VGSSQLGGVNQATSSRIVMVGAGVDVVVVVVAE
jgi:hypothetical protein